MGKKRKFRNGSWPHWLKERRKVAIGGKNEWERLGERMAFATIKSLHSKSWVYIIYLKPATSQLFSKQVRNFRLWARRLFVQSHINVKGGQLWFNLFPGAVVALLGTAYSPVLCLVPFKTCQAIAWALQRCASQTVRSQPAGPSPQAGSIPYAGKKNVDKIQMPLPPTDVHGPRWMKSTQSILL